jgi:hypothetical protein
MARQVVEMESYRYFPILRNMRQRLPIALSTTALLVALLGSTQLGTAARSVVEKAAALKAESTTVVRGPRGPRGRRGPRGFRGRTGLRGAVGATGPQGVQGVAGPQGLQGIQGPKGDPTYKRTVLVSPVGTDAENGTALLNALAGITDASATNRYLLAIEPGTYDVGTTPLAMKQFVDVEGSGRRPTQIVGHVVGTGGLSGAVLLASFSELRSLAVLNTVSAQPFSTAIYGTGVTFSRIFEVIAAAGGGTSLTVAAKLNDSSLVSIDQSSLSANGTGGDTYGLYPLASSQPTIVYSSVSGSGGSALDRGVRAVDGSTVAIDWSTIRGTDGSIDLSDSVGFIADTKLGGAATGGTYYCVGVFTNGYAPTTCP